MSRQADGWTYFCDYFDETQEIGTPASMPCRNTFWVSDNDIYNADGEVYMEEGWVMPGYDDGQDTVTWCPVHANCGQY